MGTPVNRWFIALKKTVPGAGLCDLSGLTPIRAPAGRYFADPFLADDGDETYLFFEDYDYEKGRIGCARVKSATMLEPLGIVLEEPFHISFPSVIKLDGEWYMVPERVLSGELWIYKASDFPYGWEPFIRVANGRFDDPVLHKEKGQYEIWCNEDGDKLRVFRAEQIEGPWELRVTEDRQYARSAGNFLENGWIRPTQDSLPTYGRAIKFMQGKHCMATIEPTWWPGLTGTHTFNRTDKYTVIDGRVKIKP